MPEKMPLRVGSRGSSLARRQVEIVVDELRQHHPQQEFELRTLVTEGDRRRDARFADFSGRGVFVRELEEALLRREVDIAVHSLKDMPSDLT
ncbi:MAG: hydroxymethylbilane synthase, partial [Chloroflexi bacterium]|nr:hydroxymethylbilane synthase [Chloroflexota bacterium]